MPLQNLLLLEQFLRAGTFRRPTDFCDWSLYHLPADIQHSSKVLDFRRMVLASLSVVRFAMVPLCWRMALSLVDWLTMSILFPLLIADMIEIH